MSIIHPLELATHKGFPSVEEKAGKADGTSSDVQRIEIVIIV